MVVLEKIYNFDLKNTITCGQIFRFVEEDDGSFTIVITDRVINLKYNDNILYVDSNNLENLEEIVRSYLDLDRDYVSIIENIRNMDSKLSVYLDYSYGLKMIKQNPLECIISYIISQNNSVRNITNSLNLISEKYGEKVTFNNKDYYLFPSLKKLKSISINEFRECKVGFRDGYLVEIIKSLDSNELDLEKIYNMDSKKALDYLMKFKGIGMKVASCILLFAYQKFDVYPIDTWVKKFMADDYGIIGEDNIREYCYKTYGEFSGLAIQYMFNGKRNINFK